MSHLHSAYTSYSDDSQLTSERCQPGSDGPIARIRLLSLRGDVDLGLSKGKKFREEGERTHSSDFAIDLIEKLSPPRNLLKFLHSSIHRVIQRDGISQWLKGGRKGMASLDLFDQRPHVRMVFGEVGRECR